MKKMTKKQRKILVANIIRITINSLYFIGLLTLFGGLGSLEVGRIEFHQYIVQCLISLGLIVFARYSNYKIFEEVTTNEQY